MKNQKISTLLGTIILIIIAVTIGAVVWLVEKRQQASEQLPVPVSVSTKKTVVTKTLPQSTTPTDKKTNDIAVHQPTMPTAADEAGKSPEQMVNDFYNWYIGITNYSYYRIEQLKEIQNPIIPEKLVLKSPFISSTYEKNMNKTSGGDPILCSQDNNNNVFRGYEDKVISGNSAKMYALIGLSSGSEENYKIQVMLKKEKKQWKIDEINCSQFRL
jgi:hypothetical protein